MHQLNDTQMWRRRGEDLLWEVEIDRRAHRLRSTRPEGRSRVAAALGFAAALLVAGLLALGASRPADADLTLTVSSAADPGSGGCNSSECTLREAIGGPYSEWSRPFSLASILVGPGHRLNSVRLVVIPPEMSIWQMRPACRAVTLEAGGYGAGV